MAGAYSADLRERVVAAIGEGRSRRAASQLFKVSASSAIRWMQSVQERGTCAAKPTGGDLRSQPIEGHKDWLVSLVAQKPDLTLQEIGARLAVDRSFKASVLMLWRFFRRHRISFKKNPARRRAGPSRRRPRTAGMAPRAALH